MSTSGKGLAGSHARIAKSYMAASLGCALFAVVYAQFSHGVHSPFMSFMFAIPLVGGALVALVLHAFRLRVLPWNARQFWALALASLTVACCLRGIFDIAGTSSPYLVAYPVIAGLFAIAALASLVRSKSK